MYKVYKVLADHVCYSGCLYIGAENVKEAKKILADFISEDYRTNCGNSYAVDTSRIDESDEIGDLSAKRKGIIQNNLYYVGH